MGAFAVVSLLSLRPAVATVGPPAGPVTIVTPEQFEQMLQSGQRFVPVNPEVIAAQRRQKSLRYLKDRALVAKFIAQHPNTAFTRLAEDTPSKGSVASTSGGNYLIQVPNAQGSFNTVETMGQAVKFRNLALSIQASSSVVWQRALYQSAFASYSGLYARLCTPGAAVQACGNLPAPGALPSPAQLQDASLATIKDALGAVTSQGPILYSMIPGPTLPPGPRSCAGDIGGNPSLKQIHYGDQTQNTCAAANPDGIVANFSWPYEDQLTCVKNQGARGTCHVFASTSAMEQVIARDTGNAVNLAEQDFEENENLLWSPSYYNDGGVVLYDFEDAFVHNYRFAYENQWDYNPAFNQPSTGYEYVHTCKDYPYPSKEPGCSNSAPESPQVCVEVKNSASGLECYFTPATLAGARSPYMSSGAFPILDPLHPDTTVDGIIFQLAADNAVILGFQITNNFVTPKGGYVTYSSKDVLKPLGGHAVHLVGYISNDQLADNPGTASAPPGPGGGYFIVKNSYSTCSGDLGLHYVPVAYLSATATDITLVASESH